METETQGTGSPPTFTGGTIVSGTYYATAYTAYGDCGPVGGTAQLTLDFSGGASGTIQGVLDNLNGTFSYTTSSTSITTTSTCGGGTGSQTTGAYTATSNSIVTSGILRSVSPDGGTCTQVLTLTLQ
jgi:hypothetical protein